MLISELIDEVISDVGEDTEDSDLVSKMLNFAKGALRRFPLFCRNRLLVDISYATLEIGENYLTTPTGFITERSIYYEEDGKRKHITKLTDTEFNEARRTQISGTPKHYRVVGNVIEFNKNSDADLVIYVEHFKEVDAVALDDDFFGTSDMAEILKDGIKATYYSDYSEDKTQGDKKLALFKTGLDQLDGRFMVEELPTHVEET